MKRRIFLVAVMALCLVFSACGEKDTPSSRPEDTLETFQALVDKIEYSGIFLTNFEPGSCDSTAAFYGTGVFLMGSDRMEETYKYSTNTHIANGIEDYPYTPAAIFDAAFQPYFVMKADQLHTMMKNYDPDIDGYWAPQGGGGIGGKTDVTAYEVNGNTATLLCENPIPISDTHEIQSYAEVQMEYSEEYGWRFVSCRVSDQPL